MLMLQKSLLIQSAREPHLYYGLNLILETTKDRLTTWLSENNVSDSSENGTTEPSPESQFHKHRAYLEP